MSLGMRPDLSGVDPLVVNLTHRVCIGDLPTRGARSFGDRIALVDGAESVSYRELESRANALARGLRARGTSAATRSRCRCRTAGSSWSRCSRARSSAWWPCR
ncbi:AMP-binding protein [Tsukamurella sp. PLM1]|uniref:AMP-binding protein n=1 Tax=Tsukamurella sp. PLM1 TaxID=2929795 RepID=UPI002047A1EB|nr:AMP-binding protein [Tsukamurella sp. PLM1]BDH57263.1 hypothetical protein MTP03_22020 [Tsukamurella sp. PLM1]